MKAIMQAVEEFMRIGQPNMVATGLTRPQFTEDELLLVEQGAIKLKRRAEALKHVGSTGCALGARLMLEELGEVLEAMGKGDVVELADGLADLVYVVVWTAIAHGIPLDRVWAEVCRSNLEKFPLCEHCWGTGMWLDSGVDGSERKWLAEAVFGWSYDRAESSTQKAMRNLSWGVAAFVQLPFDTYWRLGGYEQSVEGPCYATPAELALSRLVRLEGPDGVKPFATLTVRDVRAVLNRAEMHFQARAAEGRPVPRHTCQSCRGHGRVRREKDSSGKVQKPPGWTPPDIRRALGLGPVGPVESGAPYTITPADSLMTVGLPAHLKIVNVQPESVIIEESPDGVTVDTSRGPVTVEVSYRTTEKKDAMPFKAGTDLMGSTEPGQVVTAENVHLLPPGSVVDLEGNSGSLVRRLIHLHDGLWLCVSGASWCYDRVENFLHELPATLGHLPVTVTEAPELVHRVPTPGESTVGLRVNDVVSFVDLPEEDDRIALVAEVCPDPNYVVLTTTLRSSAPMPRVHVRTVTRLGHLDPASTTPPTRDGRVRLQHPWKLLSAITRDGVGPVEVSAACSEDGICVFAHWELDEDGWHVRAWDTESQKYEEVTDFHEGEIVTREPPLEVEEGLEVDGECNIAGGK